MPSTITYLILGLIATYLIYRVIVSIVHKRMAKQEAQLPSMWIPPAMAAVANQRSLGDLHIVLRAFDKSPRPDRPLAAFEYGLVNAQGKLRHKNPKAYLYSEVSRVYYDEISVHNLDTSIQSVESQKGYVLNIEFEDGESCHVKMYNHFTRRTLASDFFKYGVKHGGPRSEILPSMIRICCYIADAKVELIDTQLRAGETVDFGAIRINKDEILGDNVSIKWADLYEIAMGEIVVDAKSTRKEYRRTVVIYGKKEEGRPREKIEVPAIDVYNYDILSLYYYRKEKSNDQLRAIDIFPILVG